MEILVAEYASCGASDMQHLKREGSAILRVLTGSFSMAGHGVHVPGDINNDLPDMSLECDAGIIVAPDNLLAGYTEVLESGCDNLGSPPDAVRLASDKLKCSRLLQSSGVPTPMDAPDNGKHVNKPRFGCGCEGISYAEPGSNVAGEDEIIVERYVEGEHLSTCLIAAPSGVLALSLNRQDIISNQTFRYTGNVVNIQHPRKDECIEAARLASVALGLRGPCGVDIVLSDKPYVVDVNPRVTTSFVGIDPLISMELSELILLAFDDELPGKIKLEGSARFKVDNLPFVEVNPVWQQG